MKIAIPVKLNRENPPVAPLFGKAKWFALVEEGKIEIKANPVRGGKAVVQWLLDEKVDTLIIQEMGVSPYQKIASYGTIKLFHSGFERILLHELLEKFNGNALKYLDDINIQEIFAHHERKGSHTHHHAKSHQHKNLHAEVHSC